MGSFSSTVADPFILDCKVCVSCSSLSGQDMLWLLFKKLFLEKCVQIGLY